MRQWIIDGAGIGVKLLTAGAVAVIGLIVMAAICKAIDKAIGANDENDKHDTL